MNQIFEFFRPEKIKRLLKRYSEAFGTPVFILNHDKKPILSFPENAAMPDTCMSPLNIRHLMPGYVGVSRGSSEYLRFITEDLSDMLEMDYEIDSLSGEVARKYEEISLLWGLSSRLGAGLNVDKICSILAEEVMNICPSNNISVMLVIEMPNDPFPSPHTADTLRPRNRISFLFPKVSLGRDASRASTVPLAVDKGLIGLAFQKKESITVYDVHKDSRFEGFPYPITSVMIVPLIVEENVIGAVIAGDKLNGEEFYTTDVKLISGIASACAISIKKASLFDEIHEMLFSAAEAFSLAIEAKDPYTYGHSKRVSEMSVAVSKIMGLPPDMTNRLRLAALLHDTGKIGTPEKILHKQGALEPHESEMMKEHPMVGARMIEHIQRLREVAVWICHHHERYDGTGYPSGLKGEDIPVASRIISVTDCFDALTSDRPYRKAFSKDDAFRIMKKHCGVQFDPVIFDCFEKAIS